MENFQNPKKSVMLKTSQNGQKNDLQPKKSKFLKILVKIWVRTKKFQNLKKTFMLKTSQNGQINDLLPKKSKFLKNVAKMWVVGHRKFPKSDQNFYARNIIEWAEKCFTTYKS